jgi:hypothetical protein
MPKHPKELEHPEITDDDKDRILSENATTLISSQGQ